MRLCIAGLAALAVLVGVGQIEAQPTYSVGVWGPSVGTPVPDAFFGLPIGAGQILSPPIGGPPLGVPGMGPLPPPGMVVHGGAPIPNPGIRSLGLLPGNAPTAELDALSYGRDSRGTVFFSVDEYAAGDPMMGPGPFPPNVFTEGPFGGVAEASADVFRDISPAGLMQLALTMPLPPGPMGPPLGGNTARLDGDGIPPSGLPGVGLIEPNPPVFGPVDLGDTLDALDMDTQVADLAGPIYFSLDSALVDPVEGPGTGAAAANGFVGGDVILNPGPGAANVLYAPAPLLGLDIGGVDTDDLDALFLAEDGDGVFNPANDLLAFSVSRNSHVTWGNHGNVLLPGIDLDSIFGAPIEEGDILVPPGTPLPWAPGGIVPGPTPGILIPAEWLGLWTVRIFGPHPITGQFGDNLDALDSVETTVIPEPVTLALAASGLAGLGAYVRRRRKA